MSAWVSVAINVVVVLGSIGAVYVGLATRLTAIETRLNMDDARRDDRKQLLRGEIERALNSHTERCRAHQDYTTAVTSVPRER